jgi:hypothetical protein
MLGGVGGQLRSGLPPGLQTLHYTGGPVSVANSNEQRRRELNFRRRHLDCAVETISHLRSLKELAVQHSVRCCSVTLPLSFVSQLPASLQVGGAACYGVVSCA